MTCYGDYNYPTLKINNFLRKNKSVPTLNFRITFLAKTIKYYVSFNQIMARKKYFLYDGFYQQKKNTKVECMDIFIIFTYHNKFSKHFYIFFIKNFLSFES